MNTTNLNLILQNYIAKFEFLNAPDGANENLKWYAVRNFQNDFNIEAPDFAGMLKRCCKDTENLIDSYMQPFSGLVVIAERHGEAETIRQMFRDLYLDDGGDLVVRQAKINNFIMACDELLAKYYPNSHLYKNDQRSVMAYLWFYDPDHNYMCKTTEAQYLADAVEFYDSWGTYSDFRLDVYHRFCDELIEGIKANPDLLSTHMSRFDGHINEMAPDKALHILLFDIIYCARTYGLYHDVKIRNLTTSEKNLYKQSKAKAEELAVQLSRAEEEAMMLSDALSIVADMLSVGTIVKHKIFGKGVIREIDRQYFKASFTTQQDMKKFEVASALGNGFIAIDTPNFVDFMNKYGSVLKSATSIPLRLESARKALEPYADYLD